MGILVAPIGGARDGRFNMRMRNKLALNTIPL